MVSKKAWMTRLVLTAALIAISPGCRGDEGAVETTSPGDSLDLLVMYDSATGFILGRSETTSATLLVARSPTSTPSVGKIDARSAQLRSAPRMVASITDDMVEPSSAADTPHDSNPRR